MMENWSASCSARPSVYWHVCCSHSDNNYFNVTLKVRRMEWILHWWGWIMQQLHRFFNVLSEIGRRKIFSLRAVLIFDILAWGKMVATDVLILRWSHFQLSVTPSDRNRKELETEIVKPFQIHLKLHKVFCYKNAFLHTVSHRNVIFSN